MRNLGSRTTLLSLVLLTAACDSTGPGEFEEIEVRGVVEFYQEATLVELPDTVDSGVAFDVTVRTWGGGCVSQGPTRVSTDGPSVRIEPRDILLLADVCTSELRAFDHVAEVTLDTPGEATVRIVGRRLPADETVEIERRVVVR